MTKKVHTNKLAQESSPYLLQHAHNPVDWHPWGDEALSLAKKENKPILVSIGYSTCHWCHVMERESFEDQDVADYMNAHFINIKVDREERPDIDQIYMEAVQILTGSGGWPLNCFLLPDTRPFYGGTYFPPEPAYNRPSWIQVLRNMQSAFAEKQIVVVAQAQRLTSYLESSGSVFLSDAEISDFPKNDYQQETQDIFNKLKETFDPMEGGFGSAPKFPGTMSLSFLLAYHHHTGNEEALEHVELSLEKMIRGGIYDQLGGGFSRYSTDRNWLAPHFEKMLYDNAMLAGLLAEVYSLTGKSLFLKALKETLTYIDREMTLPDGGFYSAQDADSEGVEGKYFVWSLEELRELAGSFDGFAAFCDYYGVSKAGNWEGTNILHNKSGIEDFAAEIGVPESDLEQNFEKIRHALFEVREKRVKPGLDDKILLNWNALMCTAYAKSFSATSIEAYREKSIQCLNFLKIAFARKNDEGLIHSFKNGPSRQAAFLDDYAFFIEALINGYQITGDFKYLDYAKELTDFVIRKFSSKDNPMFYFNSILDKDILVRKIELYDNALPSGNSVMCMNLKRLGILLGDKNFLVRSGKMIQAMKKSFIKYPGSFSNWCQAYLEHVFPFYEIAIVGQEAEEMAKGIIRMYLPGKVLMFSKTGNPNYPLFKEREVKKGTKIYLCKDYVCQLPVSDLDAFRKQLKIL